MSLPEHLNVGSKAENNPYGTQLGTHGKCAFFVYEDLKELSPVWTELQNRAHYTPFQDFAWVSSVTVARERGENRRALKIETPLFVVGFEEGEAVVILPFSIFKGILGARLTWFADEISDYNGIVVDKSFADRMPDDLVDKVLEMLSAAYSHLHAAHLIRNPPGARGLVQMCQQSRTVEDTEFGSHALRLSQNWGEIYATRRSRKTRQRLRSKYRALKKTGNVCFKQIRGASAKRDAAKQILRWKSEQLIAAGKHSPFGTPAMPTVLSSTIDHITNSEKDHKLRLFGLYRNDIIIAGMVAFLSGGKFYYFIFSYDSGVDKKFSIGTQLLIKTLELSARSGFREYDFLIGDEDYKHDWCDKDIRLVDYASPFSSRGRIICAHLGLRLRLKKAAMSNKWFHDLVHAVRFAAYRGISLIRHDRVQTVRPTVRANWKNDAKAEHRRGLA